MWIVFSCMERVKRPTSLWLKLCVPCRLPICGQTSTMLSIDNITFNTLQGSASDQVYPSLVRLSLRVGKNSLSIMPLCRSIFSDFVHLSICIAACDHEVEVCFSVSWSISCSSYLLFIPYPPLMHTSLQVSLRTLLYEWPQGQATLSISTYSWISLAPWETT